MPQKSFGPFSGAQLTAIVVAVLAFLLPTTLWAVDAFTNVAIQDPVSGNKAAVDSSRKLSVYDPNSFADEYPGTIVRFVHDTVGGTCRKIATPPAGKALVLKTLAIDTFQLTVTGNGYGIYFYIGPTCSSSAVSHHPPAFGLTTVNFEPGLVVRAGQSLWVSSQTTVQAEVYGFGYLVASSWAPAPPSIAP